MSVCLSVCLSICLFTRKYQKQMSRYFICGRDLILLCTSGLVDHIVFSLNVANGPESDSVVFRCARQLVVPVGR